MPSHSALVVDASKFDPAAVSEDTHAFNQQLIDLMAEGPKWYEVSKRAPPRPTTQLM